MRRTVLLSLAILLPSSPGAARLSAQEHGQHGHHGRLGRVSFPVSCTAEARSRFEYAMAVLHSFWWEAGDSAFGAVLAADSACAMAHWGLALNAWGNPFAGGPTGPSLALGIAEASKAAARPLPTPREQGFVNAVAALYGHASAISNADRLRAYADTLARLHHDFPDDVEVTIYHALALVATAPRTDTTFARQRRAVALLDPLYDRYPDHPGLAHYIIHSTDSPTLASLGLKAARRYSKIAPAAPHAQHMPSHIFVRLGLWDETVSANLRAFDAGMAHMRATHAVGPSPEELHVLDYAVYGYLQRGRDAAARRTVARAESLGVVLSRNALVAEYNRTAMAARLPLELGDWARAASLPAPQAGDSGVSVVLRRFTRALGAARSGDTSAARAEVAALAASARFLARRQERYWSRIAEIKRDAAEAWIRFASGDTTGGLALAAAAADSEDVTDKHPVTPAELLPARELQADMLLAAGHYREALAAYRATLARERGRARSYFGAGRAAQLAGDRDAAAKAYGEYVKAVEGGDGRRPELATARAFLQGMRVTSS